MFSSLKDQQLRKKTLLLIIIPFLLLILLGTLKSERSRLMDNISYYSVTFSGLLFVIIKTKYYLGIL